MSVELDFPAAAEPPMENGELVFEAPWQSRAFGVARALCEGGVYSWDEFREYLIAAIGEWQPESGQYAYYDHFLRALERLLRDKGLVSDDVYQDRLEAIHSRPPDH